MEIRDFIGVNSEKELFCFVEKKIHTSMSGTLLDVGSGYIPQLGNFITAIDNGRLDFVYCLDPNPSFLHMKNKVPSRIKDKIVFINKKIEDVNNLDLRFDWIFLEFVFNHFNKPVESLEKLRQLLRPGGKIYLKESIIKENQVNVPEYVNPEFITKNVRRIQREISDIKEKVDKHTYKRVESDFAKTYLLEEETPHTKEQIVDVVKKSGLEIKYLFEANVYEDLLLQLICENKKNLK